MKELLGALCRYKMPVEVRYDLGQSVGSGFVQSVRKDECTIDDLNGGAFFFPISSVTSIAVDAGKAAVIVITKPA